MFIQETDYYAHPMFHIVKVELHTLAMEKLKNKLNEMLWNDGTGGLMHGLARVGKTESLNILSRDLKTRGGVSIPNYYLLVPPRDNGTVMSVLRNICYSLDLRETYQDRADHLEGRIVHYLADTAEKSGCNDILYIVDEFQRLRLRQLDEFVVLQDKCLHLDVNLIVLFVGCEPECWEMVESIERPENSHIRGRLFMEGIEFKGLTSHKDVNHCLSEIDHLHYPENGPSYAEFFTENGWKISKLSHEIWGVYKDDFKRKYHIDSWPMKYFMRTLKLLLTDFIPKHGINECGDEMIHSAIEHSRLVPSLTRKVH
ncbi:MAG: ATP-binding protein [Candidatus Thiodiazotropha endolucinida]|nr:ATP-binding protein [Candidatus Thiodiazotropha taylori]MCW4260204.1 ATP-binding protein [Candidatus Thiodiazotropha endolucinida]